MLSYYTYIQYKYKALVVYIIHSIFQYSRHDDSQHNAEQKVRHVVPHAVSVPIPNLPVQITRDSSRVTAVSDQLNTHLDQIMNLRKYETQSTIFILQVLKCECQIKSLSTDIPYLSLINIIKISRKNTIDIKQTNLPSALYIDGWSMAYGFFTTSAPLTL